MTWLLSARFLVIGLLLTIAIALVWAAVADSK
jgi:hypothetical protein